MEKNSDIPRLHALDGLRGFTIILVVLNHLNTSYISPYLPSFLNSMLFSSGVTGVSILFMLSGFFMAYIYPNPANSLKFIQKRYTRIFPLFLTMCAVMLLFRQHPALTWYEFLGIIVLAGISVHFVWLKIIKRYFSEKAKKMLFLSFLFLQFGMALIYSIVIMRLPAIVLNQQLPVGMRETIIGLVNATLTLPFGNYIPMLDGVYWSLVAEIYFYILYPILCVPLIRYFAVKNKTLKIIGVLLLIPFFTGLDILSHKIYVFSMLELYLCFYFIPGIILGYVLKKYPQKILSLHTYIPAKLSWLLVFVFLFIIFIKPVFLSFFIHPLHPLIQILWSLFILGLLAFTLDPKTKIAAFFSNKYLIFLGTISYSIYLTHSIVVHLIETAFPAQNILGNSLVIIAIFTITIALSWLLYTLIEKIYFMRDNKSKTAAQSTPNTSIKFFKQPVFLMSVIAVLLLVSIFSAYQSKFNLFSIEQRYAQTSFIYPQNAATKQLISMKESPKIVMQFQSQDNNLAILTAHMRRETGPGDPHKVQIMQFRMKEVHEKNWYAQNDYKVAEIGEDSEFPFGFPLIKDSAGKTYIAELSLEHPEYYEYITVDTSSLKGIYQINKTVLLKQPQKLCAFLLNRVISVITKTEAEFTTSLFFPFILFVFVLFIHNYLIDKKRRAKYNRLNE